MNARNRAIFEEWDRIVSIDRPRDWSYSSDAPEAWERLWEEHIGNEKLTSTHIDDAGLVCSLGWGIAMAAKDYSAALQRISVWFDHPDSRTADPISIGANRCMRALANLCLGNLEAAIIEYRDLLLMPMPKWPRMHRSMVRNDLWRYCFNNRRRKRVDPRLATLVVDTVLQYPGSKRVARRINPESATFREVYEALDGTYPR